MKDLIDYLTSNAGTETRISETHKNLICEIQRNPRSIGIDSKIKHTFRDVKLTDEPKELVGKVDLVIIDQYDEVFTVNTRVHASEFRRVNVTRNALNNQLKVMYDFFKEKFQVLVERIGVYQRKGKSGLDYYRIPKDLEDLMKLADKSQ